MAKAKMPKKNYKYSMSVGESFSNGRGTGSVYADTLDKARKEIYKLCREVKWHNGNHSDPIGYVYVYGMSTYGSGEKHWMIKDDIAYLTYDKKTGILWWKPLGKDSYAKDSRMVKADGKLGLTRTAYYNRRNKMLGL